MSEIDPINKKEHGENSPRTNYRKLLIYTYVYLLMDILETFDSEILENIRRIDELGYKIIGIIICLMVLALLKLVKFLTYGYFTFSFFREIFELIMEDQNAIEFIQQIIKRINSKK